MQKLTKRYKRRMLRLGVSLVVGALVLGAVRFIGSRQFDVLDAQGKIAHQQRNLLVFATILSALIIAPVFILTFYIVRTYRVGAKKKSTYSPEWDGNPKLEALWWGIPGVVILVLSVITWQSTHALDPYKNIVSSKPPLDIQVVALQWKWLFIYPEQGIASVNYVQFPSQRPVRFSITADAPMNSFWIPQLGGQVYAMSGMNSKLNLMADDIGSYRGSSANISGDGFADMRFVAQSSTDDAFDVWTSIVKKQSPTLNIDSYQQLALPSTVKEPQLYRLGQDSLYATVVSKYGAHGHSQGEQHAY